MYDIFTLILNIDVSPLFELQYSTTTGTPWSIQLKEVFKSIHKQQTLPSWCGEEPISSFLGEFPENLLYKANTLLKFQFVGSSGLGSALMSQSVSSLFELKNIEQHLSIFFISLNYIYKIAENSGL